MSVCATLKKPARVRKPRPNQGKRQRLTKDEKRLAEAKGRKILKRRPNMPLCEFTAKMGLGKKTSTAAKMTCWKQRQLAKRSIDERLLDLFEKNPKLAELRPDLLARVKDNADKQKSKPESPDYPPHMPEGPREDEPAFYHYLTNLDEETEVARRRIGPAIPKGDVANPEPVWFGNLHLVDEADELAHEANQHALEIDKIDEEFAWRAGYKTHEAATIQGGEYPEDIRKLLLLEAELEQERDKRETGHVPLEELPFTPKRRRRRSAQRG